MATLFEPDWDETHERHGFTYRRARLGRQVGASRLGASLYEIEPGEAAYPYHWHSANEELLIVVAGAPDLRTPDGWRTLERGEIVPFPIGERGAHQIVNRGDAAARVLVISEMRAPEVCAYPDSGKVSAFQRPPGSPGDEGESTIAAFFQLDDEVDYWQGEEPPEDP
jgi:uncharacterized cupin superfamily protein